MSVEIRVLHLVHTPGPGGTETVVENLVRWQPKTIMNQAVACPNGHLADVAGHMDTPVYTIPFDLLKRSQNPLSMVTAPRAFSILRQTIRTAVDDFAPVIVHSHSVKATILARHALSGTPGVKLLWHLHDFAPLGRFRRFLIALAIRSSDAIAAVSSDVGQSVCPGLPVHIVYNAIVPHDPKVSVAPEHEDISDETEKRITIGYLGRLHAEKGIPVLLEAFQKLNTDRENIRLIIAGESSIDDNTTRNELETYAEHLRIREKVSFTGRISNISRFYDTIDVFVLPAPREPFGLVILEALSHGCPVIACDSGGPHEILQDFSGAILVAPNDPSSLAEALVTMIRDNSYREFAEVHGPVLIREAFSPAVQTRSIQSLYEELIA